jgi:hypothetical protein
MLMLKTRKEGKVMAENAAIFNTQQNVAAFGYYFLLRKRMTDCY